MSFLITKKIPRCLYPDEVPNYASAESINRSSEATKLEYSPVFATPSVEWVILGYRIPRAVFALSLGSDGSTAELHRKLTSHQVHQSIGFNSRRFVFSVDDSPQKPLARVERLIGNHVVR